MSQVTTLLVSRDPALADALAATARRVDQLEVSTVEDVSSAYDFGGWSSVALVVIHCERASQQGEIVRLLRMIQATRRPVATIVVSEYDDPALSVTLLQLGVADYLTRPVDVDRLHHLLDSLTIRHRQPKAVAAEPAFPAISTPVEELDPTLGLGVPGLAEQVRRVAPQDATILLAGETGTGKTRLARVVHDLSRRREHPFLVVNCGALLSNLVESEIFGHIRGSFPGADHDRAGKLAEVGRGTLFLDEIDTLSPALQAKLLRVVEDREFEVVGSNETQPVLARLIAASNRPLEVEVAEGRFRSDLYFRLNVVNFNLPPLRDLRGSIPSLVRKFVAQIATKLGKAAPSIQPDVLRAMEGYAWPGNMRELRNVVERTVMLCHGSEIRLDDLPDAIRLRQTWSVPAPAAVHDRLSPVATDDDRYSRSTLAQIKRDAELARISEALRKHSNNRLRAASELGISRMTLYKKLYKYGLMTAGGRGEAQEAHNHAS